MLAKGLYKALLETKEQPNEPAPLPNGERNEEKKNQKMPRDSYEMEDADFLLIWHWL